MVSFTDVEQARARIRDQIYLSPMPYSETISRMTGSRVFFKLENLQITGSFKERGALNRLLTLSEEEARRGVIAASAGNHGMAVAFHSQRLKMAATIVMPVQAPLIKVSRVRQYGAQTLLHGSDYDGAAERVAGQRNTGAATSAQIHDSQQRVEHARVEMAGLPVVQAERRDIVSRQAPSETGIQATGWSVQPSARPAHPEHCGVALSRRVVTAGDWAGISL